ncbi:NAD(P)H nitroreductase [Serratia marcescens]|uniref:NAD(P)H nitroreductase n=1 Tax=Serratia marcescens TaxID=615 RepID=UPI0030CD7828
MAGLQNYLLADFSAGETDRITVLRIVQVIEQARLFFHRVGDRGQLLQAAAKQDQLDEAAIEKATKAPFRAPLIITVIAHCTEETKVPRWEQVVSAGCAVQAMQMAALAQGFNGIWRTGAWTEHALVREAFGCREQDEIVGFLYLGTPQLKAATKVTPPDSTPFVSYF